MIVSTFKYLDQFPDLYTLEHFKSTVQHVPVCSLMRKSHDRQTTDRSVPFAHCWTDLNLRFPSHVAPESETENRTYTQTQLIVVYLRWFYGSVRFGVTCTARSTRFTHMYCFHKHVVVSSSSHAGGTLVWISILSIVASVANFACSTRAVVR